MSTSFDVTMDALTEEGVHRKRDNLGLFVLIALSFHAMAFSAIHPRRHETPAPPPLEIDLAARIEKTPEPPPPEPAPDEPAEAPPKAALRVATRDKAAPPKAAAPAAHAGALLTAGESTQADDPVSFVTDENGATYGSGVVARGGTAEHGVGPDRTPPRSAAPAAGPAGNGLTPEADLSQKPRLQDADACRGYFPRSTEIDSGVVSLSVVVRADGRVSVATILGETPAGEGFGAAAKACILAQHFSPALDRAGRPAATATAVRLRFVR
jgi:periplasmic protein TonB